MPVHVELVFRRLFTTTHDSIRVNRHWASFRWVLRLSYTLHFDSQFQQTPYIEIF